jgi:hypothetical protein
MGRWDESVREYYRLIETSQVLDRWGDDCIPHLKWLLKERVYDPITIEVQSASKISGVGRGRLRQELKLSPARLTELLRARKIEVTLERTIVALMDRTPGNWWNQFNPAAGVCAGNVEAADIIHSADSERRLDFIEVKDWDASDEPLKAALQVIGYFCMFIACHSKRIPPYHDWPPLASVRIWFLAPDGYFKNHGGLAEVNRTLSAVHRAFDEMKLVNPALAGAQFKPAALVLDSSVTKKLFVDCFDAANIQSRIRQKQSVDNPRNVLLNGEIEMLRDWVTRAFTDGGMFVPPA